MFDHCIQAMTAGQSDVVMDLMERGPSPTCYDDLKTAYIERRTPTTAERIQRLRKLGQLTSDQRPSDLLRLIERILGRDIYDDEIAKEEFLRRLPAQTQLIVRSQTDIFTVGQLAQMADRLASVPVITQDFGILRVELSRDDDAVTLASINLQLSKLTSSNERISGEVNALKMSPVFAQSANRSSRGVSRDIPCRSRMFRGIIADGLCWYHQVCGSSARKCADGCRHVGNNGTAIRTFGQRSVAVELGLAKSFEWSFTIADVSKSILGADFLRHYGLLVDLKCKRLMDADTFLTVPTSYRRSTVSKLCVLVKNDSYSDILNEFQEVTTPCIKKCRLLGKVEHHIDTRCPRPVFARAHRLSLDLLAAAKDEFNKLLEMDVIQPSNSPWSSPLHMVKKLSGGWRACGDYRALNAASEDDRFPMPHLQDFRIHLEGKSIFSKVDLVRAYNQVPMNASDIAKTANVTPFGLFEYKRMPFGLKNAAQTFQRLMDNVLRDCSFAYVYLDDILVASTSVDEHRQHLRQLFRKLADYGLVVNPQK